MRDLTAISVPHLCSRADTPIFRLWIKWPIISFCILTESNYHKKKKQNKIKTHWNASWFCSFTVKKSFFSRQTVRFPQTTKQPAKLVFLVSFIRKVKSKGSYYRLTQTYRPAIESSRFTQVSVLFSCGYIFTYFCSHDCWQIYTQSLMQHLSGDKIFTDTMKLTVFCIRFHYFTFAL